MFNRRGGGPAIIFKYQLQKFHFCKIILTLIYEHLKFPHVCAKKIREEEKKGD